jgi:hypothetical protein
MGRYADLYDHLLCLKKNTFMSNALSLIPKDLLDFLRANEAKPFTFDRQVNRPIDVHSIEFFAVSDLKLTNFTVDTYEYHLNHDEPGEDPELRFEIAGVDLIRECNDYPPEGVLAYFPRFGEFGAFDCDHAIITMFPKVAWRQIEENLPRYVNAQWYPDFVDHYLLRPWADDRCADMKPCP